MAIEYGAGSMRDTITIQVETRTADGAGGFTKSFATDFTAKAYVKPLRGQDPFMQGQITETVFVDFVIRYRSDKTVTPAKRISYKSNIYNIISSINLEERNRYLVIRGERGVAA
jgi:SPP1 family predicted phage head-tail adaptor